jgi:hypothetical protein
MQGLVFLYEADREELMPCLTPDGAPGPLALALLSELLTPCSPDALARKLGVPLFKVRSAIRALHEDGLVGMDGDQAILTDSGREMMRRYHHEQEEQGGAPAGFSGR